MDPDHIGAEGDDLIDGSVKTVPVVSRQAGHEVNPRFETPLLQEDQRPGGVGRRVAAP